MPRAAASLPLSGAGSESWRYRLVIPPLGFAAYLRCYRLTMLPFRGWRGGRRFPWVATLMGVAFGLILGGIISAVRVIVLGGLGETASTWVLLGWRAVLFVFGLISLGLLSAFFYRISTTQALLRRVYEGGQGMLGTHELLIGDGGISWRNDQCRMEFGWAYFDRLSGQDDLHILSFGGTGFLWLPDSAFAGMAQRDAVLDFIRDRLGALRFTTKR